MRTREVAALLAFPFEARSDSAAQTAALGARLAAASRPGEVVLLDGDLGAGKTAFARGFIESLPGGGGLIVRSPTFVYARHYPTVPPVHHFDLYRLPGDSDLGEMGLWEHVGERDFVMIEWPNHVETWAFPHSTRVRFEILGAESRRVSISRS